MKLILTLFSFLFFLAGHSQINESNLVKGKWQFCVMDTIIPPFKCDSNYTTYKFKKSGKYLEKGVSMTYYGKDIKKLKGVWKLKGTTLEIDPDDFDKLKIYPKTIPLEFINNDVLFSVQKDWETAYWLFVRLKK
jgi:hypothetical protein